MTTMTTLRRGLLALALSALTSLASAATYHIELDTASLAQQYGSAGWIDLQFNAGGNTPLAAVTLSDFIGFGDSASAIVDGHVTGSLASGYTLFNDSGFNGLLHEVSYGGKIGFNVSFSGDADPSLSAAGSMFSVGLMNASASAYLGTSDASGSLVQLNWTPTATPGVGVIDAPALTNDIPTVAAPVPEPSTWAMLAGGLALLGLARRRQRA